MTEITHKHCFGTMMPGVRHSQETMQAAGKAFRICETPSGLACPDRCVEVDIDEWDDCQNCPEFENCYKLCTAKLILKIGISR